MKKIISFTVIVLSVAGAIIKGQAQGIYAGVGVGYGFPSGLMEFPNPPVATVVNSTGTTTTYTNQSYSLGSGLNVGILGGYMVTKNWGLELGISEKFSTSITSTQSSTNAVTGAYGSDLWTAKGSMLAFTPAIRLMAGDGNLHIYTVTGLIFGIPGGVTLEDQGTFNTGNGIINSSDEIWTYSGGITMGFHGALGALYMVSDKLGIFVEIDGNFQNWAPSESLVTTNTLNGTDQLDGMTTSQKQINYVNSYTTTPTLSPGSPTQSTKIYLPYSSFGISIGATFAFGGGSGSVAK